MRLEGLLFKVGGYWVAEVPALDLSSQGTSPERARAMLKDAIESLVARRGFLISPSMPGTGTPMDETVARFYMMRSFHQEGRNAGECRDS